MYVPPVSPDIVIEINNTYVPPVSPLTINLDGGTEGSPSFNVATASFIVFI